MANNIFRQKAHARDVQRDLENKKYNHYNIVKLLEEEDLILNKHIEDIICTYLKQENLTINSHFNNNNSLLLEKYNEKVVIFECSFLANTLLKSNSKLVLKFVKIITPYLLQYGMDKEEFLEKFFFIANMHSSKVYNFCIDNIENIKKTKAVFLDTLFYQNYPKGMFDGNKVMDYILSYSEDLEIKKNITNIKNNRKNIL